MEIMYECRVDGEAFPRIYTYKTLDEVFEKLVKHNELVFRNEQDKQNVRMSIVKTGMYITEDIKIMEFDNVKAQKIREEYYTKKV